LRKRPDVFDERPDGPDPDAIVPIGTSPEDGLRLLEDAGYQCSLMENERFRHQPPDASHRVEGYYAENIDFIQCSRTDRMGLSPESTSGRL
jgi:hypothetical protein